jgi:hypothetical protein
MYVSMYVCMQRTGFRMRCRRDVIDSCRKYHAACSVYDDCAKSLLVCTRFCISMSAHRRDDLLSLRSTDHIQSSGRTDWKRLPCETQESIGCHGSLSRVCSEAQRDVSCTPNLKNRWLALDSRPEQQGSKRSARCYARRACWKDNRQVSRKHGMPDLMVFCLN